MLQRCYKQKKGICIRGPIVPTTQVQPVRPRPVGGHRRARVEEDAAVYPRTRSIHSAAAAASARVCVSRAACVGVAAAEH